MTGSGPADLSGTVLAFTACSRPGYLSQVLDSWGKVRRIEDVTVAFRVEPGCPEVLEMCDVAFGGRALVHRNRRRYGEAANQWHAIDDAFTAGAEFVILAEDDDLVSTDILEYFAWARDQFRDRPEVLTACTFRHYRVPGGLAGVSLFGWFQCNVWGIWRDRWENLIRGDWHANHMADGWDTKITRYWVGERGYRVALPCEARCQNIGETGGAHGDGPRAQSDCWSPDIGPQEYVEVPA